MKPRRGGSGRLASGLERGGDFPASPILLHGDNVDTDVIIPARYLNIADRKEFAAHCMEDIDADFVKVVIPPSLVLAVAYGFPVLTISYI